MREKLSPRTIDRLGGFPIPPVEDETVIQFNSSVKANLKLPQINTAEELIINRCVRAAIELCERYTQIIFFRRIGDIQDDFLIHQIPFVKAEPYDIFEGIWEIRQLFIDSVDETANTIRDKHRVLEIRGTNYTPETLRGRSCRVIYNDLRNQNYIPPQSVVQAVVLVASSMYSLRLGEPIAPGLGNTKEVWLERSGAKSILDEFDNDRLPRERLVTRLA